MNNILNEIKFLEKENRESLVKAHEYIKENQDKVINQPNRNTFHLMPEIGWMNDPNGFSVYNGEYHMFYQYFPYDVKWGPMHWGHAKSKDLITWEYLPVALAPGEEYDKNGCFSGSAIQINDKHVLMYTGHVDSNLDFNGSGANKDAIIKQVQCLAIGDGITYNKIQNNPVIDTKDIPNDSSLADFRDPKIWEKDGMFYCVVGSRDIDESGKIAFYKSSDLMSWTFVGFLDHSKHELGRMWECPDLFELDGQDVLLMSPQQMHDEEFRYKNGNTTVYFIGEFNYETGKLNKHSYDEIDYGLDFYAPQTTLAPDGRRIMMAWMQSWDRNIPSDKFGWTSSMTLPRELKVKNNKLYQLPVKEIEDYRCDYVKYETVELCESQSFPSIRGRQLELKIKVDLCEAHSFTIKAMKAVEEETTISFDTERSVLCFDRSRSGSGIDQNKPLNRREMPITILDNTLELRIFIDTYAIEIFVQDGEYAMSSTVYSNLESDGIAFESDGKVIMELEKWSLKGVK